MGVRSIESLKEMMWRKADFKAIFDGMNALRMRAIEGEGDAIEALAEYARDGHVPHARTHAMAGLAEVTGGAAKHLQKFFRDALEDQHTRYWAIRAYANAAGNGAFARLIELAADESLKLEERAHAVKCLAQSSGQAFDRELPADPGLWKKHELRLDEIFAWQQTGCQLGSGYAVPPRDPALDCLVTPLEFAAARLDARLSKLRSAKQDLAAPSNWLTPADPKVIQTLSHRFSLPPEYIEFLRRFSPLNVRLPRGPSELWLFGASELIRGQDGYSFNPVTKEVILDWPDEYLVIASQDGNPFVLDMGSSKQHGKILTAPHGEGKWDFRKYATSFVEFLNSLA